MRAFLRLFSEQQGLELPDVLLPSWGMLQALAMLAAVLIVAWRTRRDSWAPLIALGVGFVTAAGGTALLGALAKLPALVRAGFDFEAAGRGYIVAYGALLGLVAGYALVLERLRAPVLPGLDALAPALGAVVFFARIGCFLGGCDYGRVSGLPWAVRFPANSPAFKAHAAQGLILASDTLSLPVHPTQLYEAGVGVAMLAVALVAERRRAAPGLSFALTAATYAVGRFTVELWRGDDRPMLLGVSFSQWVSLAVMAALLLWRLRVKAELTHRVEAASAP